MPSSSILLRFSPSYDVVSKIRKIPTMSVNQVSQDYLWWNTTPHHNQSNLDSESILFQNFNLNHSYNDVVEDRRNHQAQQQLELMFEKPLTPSDVGKLNRLVIPKQHAERHFPLNTSNGAESGGMLLAFEDEDGKFWRFRYSYWNSSQSYVLTKGWSRFVKDQRLNAGDVVVFQRHPSNSDRMFIRSRRRNDPSQPMTDAAPASTSVGGGGLSYPAHHHSAYPAHQNRTAGVVNQSKTQSFNGSSSSRTLRLFGVNMEYQFESDQSEPATPDGSSTSSPNGPHQLVAHSQHYNHLYPQANYYSMNNHMVQQDASHSQNRG